MRNVHSQANDLIKARPWLPPHFHFSLQLLPASPAGLPPPAALKRPTFLTALYEVRPAPCPAPLPGTRLSCPQLHRGPGTTPASWRPAVLKGHPPPYWGSGIPPQAAVPPHGLHYIPPRAEPRPHRHPLPTGPHTHRRQGRGTPPQGAQPRRLQLPAALTLPPGGT